MTDGRSNIAGNYWTSSVPEITVWLDEGAITVNAAGYGTGWRTETFCTVASGLSEGEYAALSNDTGNTYALTFGIPVAEKPQNGEALTMFYIVSIEPPENTPANTTAADSLAKRLAGKFLRKARVRVLGGVTAVQKAQVMCNGGNACAIGVGDTLKYNITSGSADKTLCFDSEANGGTGVIPFHYVAAGVDGDTYTILCGITGAFTSVTGA